MTKPQIFVISSKKQIETMREIFFKHKSERRSRDRRARSANQNSIYRVILAPQKSALFPKPIPDNPKWREMRFIIFLKRKTKSKHNLKQS